MDSNLKGTKFVRQNTNDMTHSTDLKAIPLTQEDINLITFALRRLAKETDFKTMKEEAKELIAYIENENK